MGFKLCIDFCAQVFVLCQNKTKQLVNTHSNLSIFTTFYFHFLQALEFVNFIMVKYTWKSMRKIKWALLSSNYLLF